MSKNETDVDFDDFVPGPMTTERPTEIYGLSFATFRVQAYEIRAFSLAGVINRAQDFSGVGIAAYNNIGGSQSGLTLGVFNHAENLNGIQIGVLNHVASNPPMLRWLPLFNAAF